MEGAYVDEEACLCMIQPTAAGEWTVDGASRDEAEYEATITQASESVLRIGYGTHEVQGMFNGTDRLVWGDGKVWQRLRVSQRQVYTLRHRPYVPLTLVAAHIVRTFVSGLLANVAALLGSAE